MMPLLALAMLTVSCSTAPQTESAPVAETSPATATTATATPSTETTPTATADDAAPTATEIAFYAQDGVAIAGADPVAYFTAGDYVPGDAAYTYDWNGATWQFASAENQALFAADPEKYAPQYGGFCAWAVSQGYTAPIDPTAWKIVDGKLYLNYDKKIQAKWEKDIPGNITKADGNWPGVLSN